MLELIALLMVILQLLSNCSVENSATPNGEEKSANENFVMPSYVYGEGEGPQDLEISLPNQQRIVSEFQIRKGAIPGNSGKFESSQVSDRTKQRMENPSSGNPHKEITLKTSQYMEIKMVSDQLKPTFANQHQNANHQEQVNPSEGDLVGNKGRTHGQKSPFFHTHVLHEEDVTSVIQPSAQTAAVDNATGVSSDTFPKLEQIMTEIPGVDYEDVASVANTVSAKRVIAAVKNATGDYSDIFFKLRKLAARFTRNCSAVAGNAESSNRTKRQCDCSVCQQSRRKKKKKSRKSKRRKQRKQRKNCCYCCCNDDDDDGGGGISEEEENEDCCCCCCDCGHTNNNNNHNNNNNNHNPAPSGTRPCQIIYCCGSGNGQNGVTSPPAAVTSGGNPCSNYCCCCGVGGAGGSHTRLPPSPPASATANCINSCSYCNC